LATWQETGELVKGGFNQTQANLYTVISVVIGREIYSNRVYFGSSKLHFKGSRVITKSVFKVWKECDGKIYQINFSQPSILSCQEGSVLRKVMIYGADEHKFYNFRTSSIYSLK
jgi:hypothetical protein